MGIKLFPRPPCKFQGRQTISNLFLKLFQPPVYPDDPEKNRVAGILHALILAIGAAGLVFLFIGVPFLFSHKPITFPLALGFFVLSPIAWVFLRQNRLSAASLVIVLGLHLLVNRICYLGGGIEARGFLLYALLVVPPFLIMSFRAALISTLGATLEIVVFAYLGWAGLSPPKVLPGLPLAMGLLAIVTLWILFLTSYLSREGWKKSRDQARQELAKRIQSDEEKEKLEEQLFQSRKMESLGRMAGAISHDSINLLTIISLRLQLVQRKRPEDKELAEAMEKAEESVQSAVAIARSLVSFYKTSELRRVKVELDGMIRQSLPVLKDLLGDQTLLETTLSAPEVIVPVDPAALQQVLQNLVVNARDAMGEKGEVAFRTSVKTLPEEDSRATPGPYFLIRFRDNGCGMNWETKDRMFEPFFTTKAHGTGLGLATVFGVVRQHKGFVEVDSAPGKGTEFRIYLPVA